MRRIAALEQQVQQLAQQGYAALGPPLDWEEDAASPGSDLDLPRTPWSEGERWPGPGEVEEAVRAYAVQHGEVSSTAIATRLGRAHGLLEESADFDTLMQAAARAIVMLADRDGCLEVHEHPNSAGECSALVVENDWFLDRINGLGDVAPDVSATYRERVANWLCHRQYTEKGYSAGLRYERHVRDAWRPRRGRRRGPKWELNPGAEVQA